MSEPVSMEAVMELVGMQLGVSRVEPEHRLMEEGSWYRVEVEARLRSGYFGRGQVDRS